MHGSRMILLLGVILIFTKNLYSEDFVYTNNNKQEAANTVSGFSIAGNGALTPIAGSPFGTGGIGGGGGLFAANWITSCSQGNFLYAPNAGSGDVTGFSINPSTGVLTRVPGSPFPVAGGPSSTMGMSLACTPNSQFLMVANGDARLITVFSIAGNGALTPIAGSPFSTIGVPDGIKVSPDNKFLAVAEIGPVEIFSIASNGSLMTVPGSPFFGSGGSDLVGVDINCTSNLLFGGETSAGDTIVNVFDVATTGALTPIPGSPFIFPPPHLFLPLNSNVVLLNANDKLLFVSNVFSDSIRVFTVASDGSLTEVPGSPFPAAGDLRGMATNRAGSFLYVATEQSVYGYNIGSGGALTSVPGSPFPSGDFSQIFSLTVFPAKACAQIANDKVNFVVQSTSLNPTPVAGGPAGVFTITARLTNKSTENVLEPINAIVKTLTNGNKLLSATEGNGGAGSKQAIDAGADNILILNESATVQFRIGLASRNRFSFFVDVSGIVNGDD